MDEEISYNPEANIAGDSGSSHTPPTCIPLVMQVALLQNHLMDWRDVILPLHTVLIWDKQWHPGTVIGGTTIFFMSLWLLDPSIITTLSIIGLTITVSDYLVPFLSSILLKNEPWSPKKQEKFETICQTLISSKKTVAEAVAGYYAMRTEQPKIYYGATICLLVLMAWVGNNINNLFLTYVIITLILMLPGLEAHGYLKKYSNLIIEKIAELSNTKIKQKPL